MTGGRYGTPGSKGSNEAELAEIRVELRNQGKEIASVAGKMDNVTKAVTEMSVQMGHLVTKESCAKGRAEMADDLKKRMDSERDITGHNINVGDLIKEYVRGNKRDTPKHGKLTPVPSSIKPSSSQDGGRKDRGAAFWIGLVSGMVALVVAFYSASTFIDRTIAREERTEQVLIRIQQSLENQSGNSKQAPPQHKSPPNPR